MNGREVHSGLRNEKSCVVGVASELRLEEDEDFLDAKEGCWNKHVAWRCASLVCSKVAEQFGMAGVWNFR